MLRRSGLTPTETRKVLAAAGAVWDSTKSEEALKLMFHDVHFEDAKRLSHVPRKFSKFKVRPLGRGKGKDIVSSTKKINYEDAEDPDNESGDEEE